jgi:hypothetical protein
MGRRSTHRNESQDVTPAKAGAHVRDELDSCSPAFAEDKLRGNDVTFDGGGISPCLSPSMCPNQSEIPIPRLRDRNEKLFRSFWVPFDRRA